ncbi:MAG: hypothetical protein B6D65_00115 [candidate division Zixibacteria bacterium 4484_93]|nr:MAG: hypothetical protein B6D65_00115 [candidate division Zixibacteria bacterium 4484_93]
MRRYLMLLVVSALMLSFASALAEEQKSDKDTTKMEQKKVEKKKPNSLIKFFDYFIDKDKNGINDHIERKSSTKKKSVPSKRKTKHTTREVTSRGKSSKRQK